MGYRNSVRRGLLAALLGAVICGCGISGCSSGSGGGGGSGAGPSTADCDRYCQKNSECNPTTSRTACMRACAGVAVSTACIDASIAVDCIEFNKDFTENPSWLDACFPACATQGTHCDNDWATTCNNGRQATVSCSYGCTANGQTYSGVCAASYQGQTCPNGSECCWCL